MRYSEYPDSPIKLEEQILEQWRSEDLFRRTLEQRAGAEEFVFFEGPPTANGRPGIHHVLSRTIKDLVCRYQALKGKHVTRIAGWDTHGLPVEIEAEKKLGISGKKQIEEVGVARFNAVCRESVFTYKEEWERLSERIAYWLDYSEPYVTFEPRYIESVWWILRQFADKGLIYRGYKSVPYCPRCGTALSSHEVAQGYDDVADPSLYFLAPLRGGPEERRAFVVWTTTPWTLPANAALALHPDLTYAEVEHEGRGLIVAEARVAALFGEDARITRRYPARELEGAEYVRPFDLLAEPAGVPGWRVVLESFVTAEDGTGIVHLAPAFGADDYAAGQRHSLPMLRPIDDAGRFDARTPLVGGLFVKEADPVLLEDLRARSLVFRYSLETHTYPHCWRCSSPLIYMARDSWYIRTTSVKEAMLANNAQVGWHPPEVGSGRFGEWLEGNVDWAISRERYWGTPLPIWVCRENADHYHVIGSLAELATRAGGLPADFDPHKPFIDDVTITCTDCGGVMQRTPEVVDVWFDSGAMPFAQWHYPFENQDAWSRHFPADFICEGVDQTRGWFYSLMAISTMLGHGTAYRNVVVNDLVLDAEGQKMSKSRGNVVNPWTAIEQFGADAIRWYFLANSQPWVSKRYDADALADAARRVFDTVGNTYRFFALYANLEGWEPRHAEVSTRWQHANKLVDKSDDVLDRWIRSRLNTLVAQVRDDLDAYEMTHAARAIGEFVVDDVSNWYVRRTRDRFWGSGDAGSTDAAFATLHHVLSTVAQLLAPFTPFHADWLYRALNGGASVHLANFPEPAVREPQLEAGMEAVRVLARLGRAAREKVRIRVRQPLRTLHAVVPGQAAVPPELLAVLRDELNVKEVRFMQGSGDLVTYRAQPNFRVLGKRFGARMQQAAAAIRALDSETLRGFVAGGPLAIVLEGEPHALGAEEIELLEDARGDLVVETDAGYTLALDPTLDDELRREGLARELVNRIQRLRKDAGLAVSDRIRLAVRGAAEVEEAARAHGDYISAETLATVLDVGDRAGLFDIEQEFELDGHHAHLALAQDRTA